MVVVLPLLEALLNICHFNQFRVVFQFVFITEFKMIKQITILKKTLSNMKKMELFK